MCTNEIHSVIKQTPTEEPPRGPPLLIACSGVKFMFTAVRLEAVTHAHTHTQTDTQPHTHTHTQADPCISNHYIPKHVDGY